MSTETIDGPARRSHFVKLIRYSALSVVFTLFSIAGLAVLVGVINFPAGWANFGIVAVSIPPGFELNRRWVWSAHTGPWWSAPQLLPYGAFSFAALGLSTLSVHLVAAAAAHVDRAGRTVAVEGASLASFGSLWLLQYFVLDQVLFRSSPAPVRD